MGMYMFFASLSSEKLLSKGPMYQVRSCNSELLGAYVFTRTLETYIPDAGSSHSPSLLFEKKAAISTERKKVVVQEQLTMW